MEAAAVAVVVVVVVFIVSRSCMVMARRSHRRSDTLGRFSAATDALRTIAEHPTAEIPPGMDHVELTPSVHMLEDSRVLSLDPALLTLPERRRPARPAADVLARRQTICIN